MNEPTKRTMGGLRETLFKELDDLRAGSVAPSRARALAALGNAIVQSVATEATCVATHGKEPAMGSMRIGDESGKEINITALHS